MKMTQQHLKGTCNRTNNIIVIALVILCTNIFDKTRNSQVQSKHFCLFPRTNKIYNKINLGQLIFLFLIQR